MTALRIAGWLCLSIVCTFALTVAWQLLDFSNWWAELIGTVIWVSAVVLVFERLYEEVGR